MFIAHFGAGFGARSLAPRVSLGTLFFAAQFIDLLWPTLLLLGIESVRIDPGNTLVTPLDFEHYPVTHSLAAVLGWGMLLGVIHLFLRRNLRSAVVIGSLVISHWLLDALVHRPDLPLWPGSSIMIGLQAWDSLVLTALLESLVFGGGLWLYARHTRARDRIGRWGLVALASMLALIQASNMVSGPPPSVEAIAWAGHLQWLFIPWAAWVDRHRDEVTVREPRPAPAR